MLIFYANRDKINDPDKIQVGQQLTIPAADNG
jgi:nucleoid-associated protein YgaU